MAEHMERLSFKYKIVPYVANSQNQGIDLPHSKEQESVDYEDDKNVISQKLEDSVVSIYYYDRSYFATNQVAERVLPKISYGSELDDSPNYCLNLQWKSGLKNSTYHEVMS